MTTTTETETTMGPARALLLLQMRRRASRWLLVGVTFAMVIALSACARGKQRAAARDAARDAARANASERVSAHPAFVQSAPPPKINIFGELDDLPGATPTPITEAGFQQHTFVDEGYDADVAVSPDGRWLVFASTRHNERGDIYLQRTNGLSVTQLTNDDAQDAHPAFSHDGGRIAFCSTRAGTWDLYVMDADGRNVVQVTSGPMQDMHPSFSPDGKRLVYCSTGSRSGQWELWTVDLETNQKRMIGFGVFPSWSPDPSRDRIAFQRARGRGSRWFSLWTLELIDGEAHHVTEVALSTNAAVVSPVWSPCGRKLAFTTIVEPARTSGGGQPAGQQDIWTINADGTQRRRLTDGHGLNAAPFWGVDDRIYFVSDRGGNECIWSTSAKMGASDATMNARKPAPQDQAAVGSAE